MHHLTVLLRHIVRHHHRHIGVASEETSVRDDCSKSFEVTQSEVLSEIRDCKQTQMLCKCCRGYLNQRMAVHCYVLR
jgi:hypothetical protein